MCLHIEREPGQGSAQPQKGLQWRLPVAGGREGASAFAPPPRGQESRESVGTAVRRVYLALCWWRPRSDAVCADRPSSVVAVTSTVASTSGTWRWLWIGFCPRCGLEVGGDRRRPGSGDAGGAWGPDGLGFGGPVQVSTWPRVTLSSAQVEAARKAIRTAQVERYVPEHERCCWCLCCSCEVRKHLSHGNLTVLHGGLLEHLARWDRGWEPHPAFAYVYGKVDLGWARGRTLLWPVQGGLPIFRDRGLMVAMVPHGVGGLTRKASWFKVTSHHLSDSHIYIGRERLEFWKRLITVFLSEPCPEAEILMFTVIYVVLRYPSNIL